MKIVSDIDVKPALRHGPSEPVREHGVASVMAQGELRYQIPDDLDHVRILKAQWLALELSAKTPVFFQSYSWINHAWQVLSQSDRDFDPVVATAWLGNELVAVWPLRRFRRVGGTFLSDLGDPFSQYSEIIIADGVDARRVLEGLLQHIKDSFACDGLLLRKVRSGSNAEKLIGMGATPHNIGFKAPWLSFEPFPSFDDYMSTLNSKSRKNLRNFRNRLTRQGPLEHMIVSEHDKIAPALSDIFAKRHNWLLERGVTSSAFRHPGFEKLVTGLADETESGVSPLVTALMHNGKPIASQVGFIHNSRYYAYISARDAELDAAVSAGRIHLQEILQACHKLGVTDVDLLAPANPYKLTWTKQAEDVFDLFYPLTKKGEFLGNQILLRALPAARKVFSSLPATVRRVIADTINSPAKSSTHK